MGRLEEMDRKYREKREAKEAETAATIARLNAKATAELEAKQAAKEAAQLEREQKRQQEAAARFDKERKEPARRAWVANGGSEAEFNEIWPELRKKLLLEAAQQTEQRARARQGEWLRNRF